MPFAPGHAPSGGRPKKGTSLKELLRNHPIKDKKALVIKAFELALAGDVRWAEWIARNWNDPEAESAPDGRYVRRIIIEDVQYGEVVPVVADAEDDDVLVRLPGRTG